MNPIARILKKLLRGDVGVISGALTFFLVLVLLVTNFSRANPGDRDPLFSAGTGANGVVRTFVLMPDTSIIIGGEFTTYNGGAMSYLGNISSTGTANTAFTTAIGAGPNSFVLSGLKLSTGDVLLGGDFTQYNGFASSGIALINADGTRDTGFTPGTGTGNGVNDTNRVYGLAEQTDGKLIIGGFFSTYNGTTRQRVARINADGTLDTSFDSSSGANNNVYAVALQSDGKVLIGGDFTTYGGTTRNRIARINTDGSLDTSFNPGTGANATVFGIALQSDGEVIISGSFTSVNGSTRNRIARLNTDGSLDTSYTTGTGFNNTARSLAVQDDDKALVAGFYTSYNGVSRKRIARLNTDGTIDTSFNPGSGANNNIYAIALLADGSIMVGGLFSNYDGVSSNSIARLDSSTLDTDAPTVTFTTASFASQTLQVISFTVSDVGDGITNTPVVESNIDGLLVPSCMPALPIAENVTSTCSVTLTGDGIHTVAVTVNDGASNAGFATNTNQGLVYIVDTTPPVIPQIFIDPDTPADLNAPLLTVCPTDNVQVASAIYQVTTGTAPAGAITALPLCTAIPITTDYLQTNTVSVTVYDTAGNSASDFTTYYPSASFESPVVYGNSTNPITFNQTIGDGVNTIQLVGPGGISSASATFTNDNTSVQTALTLTCDQAFPFELPTPANQTIGAVPIWVINCEIPSITASGTVEVAAIQAGSPGPVSSQHFVVEDENPDIVIHAPTTTSNAVIQNTTIQLSDESGFSSINFDGGAGHTWTTAHCYQTTNSATVTFPTSATDITCDGGDLLTSGLFEVGAVDQAGNGTTQTKSYVIDSIAPQITFISASGYTSLPITVNFSIVDPAGGAGVASIDVIDAIDSVENSTGLQCPLVAFPVAAGTTFQCTADLITDGSHELTIAVTDQAGNIGYSSTYTITVDSTFPVITSPTVFSNNPTPTIAYSTNTITLAYYSSELLNNPSARMKSVYRPCTTTSVAPNYYYTCERTASDILTGVVLSSSFNITATIADFAGNGQNFTSLISGIVTKTTTSPASTATVTATAVPVVFVSSADTGDSSGGGGSGGRILNEFRVCKDKKAFNYRKFGIKDNSLCLYAVPEKKVITKQPAEPSASLSRELVVRASADNSAIRKLAVEDDLRETGNSAVDIFVRCEPLLKENITAAGQNNSVEVNKLVGFLNWSENEQLPLDGTFDTADINAVKRFQRKYFNQIIAPWGGTETTGNVAGYTRGKINVRNCAQKQPNLCPLFREYFRKGDNTPEIKAYRKFLNLLQHTDIPIVENFDDELETETIKFQELYRDEVLKPINLTQGTGIFYEFTNKSVNKITCE